MGLGDVRYTVLEIVNKVQERLGLDTSTLSANRVSRELVDLLNMVCTELSDFGDWPETITSANITAVSGQADYSISTSANVKNIGDIFFMPATGPMRFVTVSQMRIMTRVSATGQPTQFTIWGTDANANPNIRVRPTPAQNEDGELFSINYYIRPPLYTVDSGSEVVPFPGEIVVNGLLSMHLLNESGGAPNDKYTRYYQLYVEGRKEALNRFKGDTGYSNSFVPSYSSRRRR